MRSVPLLASVILAAACNGPASDDARSSVQQCELDVGANVCTAPSQALTASADEASAPAVAADVTYAIAGPSPGKKGYVVFTAATSGTHTLYFGDAEPIRVCDEEALCASEVTSCGDLERAAQYAFVVGEAYVIELKPSAANHPFRLHIVGPDAPPPPPPPPPPPGDGSLKLAMPVFYGSTGTFPGRISVGDLNGDGAVEVVMSNPDDASGSTYVDVLGNSGSGAFAHAARVNTSVPWESVISDFDGDGTRDIAVVTWDGMGGLPLSYAHGEGNFTYTTTTFSPPGIELGRTLSGGDFDEDGSLDLVATYDTLNDNDPVDRSGFVIIRMPGFEILQEVDAFGLDTSAAIAGDFNGDGNQDVIVGSRAAPVVRLYLGNGTGTVTFDREITLPVNNRITRLFAFNLDGNGATDFAAFGFREDGIGYASVTLSSTSGFATQQLQHAANGLAAGDFDHDGLIDLISGVPAAAADNDMIFFRNTTSGFVESGLVGGAGRCCVVGADVNNDGLADLVTNDGGPSNTPGIAVYLGTP